MIPFRCSDWRAHAAEEKCCCGVFVFDVELQLSHLTLMKTTLHSNVSSVPEVCFYATVQIQFKFNVLLLFMYHVLYLLLCFYKVLLNMLPLHWYL